MKILYQDSFSNELRAFLKSNLSVKQRHRLLYATPLDMEASISHRVLCEVLKVRLILTETDLILIELFHSNGYACL